MPLARTPVVRQSRVPAGALAKVHPVNAARPWSLTRPVQLAPVLVLLLVASVGLQVGRPPAAQAVPTEGLSLTATAGPTAVSRVGQQIAYAVVVRNRGAEDLADLLVSDPAAGLSALVCVPVAQGGTLAGGASTTCRATRTTTAADLAGASLVDTVRAGAKTSGRAGVSAAVTVTVAVQASAPKATDDTATVVAGGPMTLLAGATNDAPAQSGGPALDPSRTVLVGGTPDPAYGEKAVTTAEGRWWVQADGSVRFQVGSGPGGTTAQVGYRVYDLAGRSAVGQLRVPVLAGPADAGSILVVTTRQDRPVDADVLATADAGLDTTGDPTTFDPRSVRLTSVWPRQGYAVTYLATRLRIRIGDVGDFLVVDGRIRFTPAPGFSGGTPAITWTASTYAGTSAVGRVSTTVARTTSGSPAPARSGPVAVADRAVTTSQIEVSLNAGLNDLAGPDPLDGTTVAFPRDQLGRLPAGSVIAEVDGEQRLTVPGEGEYRTYRTTDDGNVWFRPADGFVGAVTPVDYTIADTAGRTGRATLTVSVLPGATARADVASTRQGRSVRANVLLNDDAGGAPQTGTNPGWLDPRLTMAGLPDGSTLDAEGVSLVVPGQGVYTVNPTKTVTFAPEPRFRGTATPVTLALRDRVPVAYADPAIVEATSTLTVTVLGADPVAKPDTRVTAPGEPLVVPVLANDTSGSPVVPLVGSSLRLRLASGLPTGSTLSADAKTLVVAGRGTFLAAGTGDVLFVPLGTTTGAVPSIGYQVADVNGTTARSTLTVTVG